MSSLRILLLAPDCNPESVTNPSIAYYHAEALARLHEVTLVVHAANEEAVLRRGESFHKVVPIQLPLLDRLYYWMVRRVFKHDYGRQSLTAASYPRHVCFELEAWRRLKQNILGGSFDVALRLTPYNRVFPSPFAWLLRNGPIPFVAGPLSGGLPWMQGFSQLQQQQRAAGYWIWNLRSIANHAPFAKSTYAAATAIIVGSSHAYTELAKYRDKLFFMPTEIGVNPSLFEHRAACPSPPRNEKLALIFVGRLIPLKACDLAIRAATPLLRSGAAHLTIVGDGPERERLEQLAESLGVGGAVSFVGWLAHPETLAALQGSDVLVFPSLREIGGGVVFEALASGAVPVVADFGGPGDVINDDVGYRIAMVNEGYMISRMEAVLQTLAKDRHHLEILRRRGMAYARRRLSYDARVRVISEIVMWAVGRGPKPDLPLPQPTRGGGV
jgi:glycosyltransferase involved in cell wall biosynthesis